MLTCLLHRTFDRRVVVLRLLGRDEGCSELSASLRLKLEKSLSSSSHWLSLSPRLVVSLADVCESSSSAASDYQRTPETW